MNGVIYARYSSDNQREESIEGQLRECNDFAKRNDITIIDSYIDRAFSATTDKRPAFQKMIKDSAKNMFDVIMFRSWIGLPVIVMTRLVTRHSFARTVLR